MTLRLRVGGTLGALILLFSSAALLVAFAAPAAANTVQLNVPAPPLPGPIEEAVQTVGDAVESGGSAVGDAVQDTGDAVGGAVESTGDQVGDAVGDTGGQVGDSVGGSVGETITDTSGTVGETVKETSGKLGGTISGGSGSVGAAIEETTGTVGSSISGALEGTGSDQTSGPGSPFSGFPGIDGGSKSTGGDSVSGSATAGRDLSALLALANSIEGLDLASDRLVGAAGDVAGPLDFGGFATEAVEAAKAFAFPLALTVLVVAFMVIQGRLDRRDPKLALATVDQDDELLSFS